MRTRRIKDSTNYGDEAYMLLEDFKKKACTLLAKMASDGTAYNEDTTNRDEPANVIFDEGDPEGDIVICYDRQPDKYLSQLSVAELAEVIDEISYYYSR